jgi:serine protease Do
VGFDAETDVAVVKIDAPRDLPTLTLGDSNAAQVGDWVLAMGSPFGLDQTVTAGIISKKERESPFFNVFQRFLQTPLSIVETGGPLVNMRGEVIGMNFRSLPQRGLQRNWLRLPANETNFVYKQLVAQGKVTRGFLGINLDSVHDEFAKVYGLSEAKGAIVTSVSPTDNGIPTPAAKAGLQPNDVIVEFEGVQILNAPDLIQRVASTAVGQSATLVYLREVDGKLEKKTATVVLAERPPSAARDFEEPSTKPNAKGAAPKGNALHLGITLAELTPQLVAEKHLTGVHGLFVKEIDPNGLVAEVRVQPTNAQALSEGDIVNRINKIPVNTLADFQRVVSGLKAGDPIVLNVTTVRGDPKGATTTDYRAVHLSITRRRFKCLACRCRRILIIDKLKLNQRNLFYGSGKKRSLKAAASKVLERLCAQQSRLIRTTSTANGSQASQVRCSKTSTRLTAATSWPLSAFNQRRHLCRS